MTISGVWTWLVLLLCGPSIFLSHGGMQGGPRCSVSSTINVRLNLAPGLLVNIERPILQRGLRCEELKPRAQPHTKGIARLSSPSSRYRVVLPYGYHRLTGVSIPEPGRRAFETAVKGTSREGSSYSNLGARCWRNYHECGRDIVERFHRQATLRIGRYDINAADLGVGNHPQPVARSPRYPTGTVTANQN